MYVGQTPGEPPEPRATMRAVGCLEFILAGEVAEVRVSVQRSLGKTMTMLLAYGVSGSCAQQKTPSSIENWVRVPRQDPNYRAAAVEVIRFARALDALA